MMATVQTILRGATVAVTSCAAMMGLAGNPAHARVFIGIGVPFYGPRYYPPPIYYPPPVYYPPPPVYYAPPPAVYAPPQTYSPVPPPGGGRQTCYAGPNVCPMDRPTVTGASCYCLGYGGVRVWGHAN